MGKRNVSSCQTPSEIACDSQSTYTPNSLHPHRHLLRRRRFLPRRPLLHLALLEGGHQRLLSGQRVLSRGIVGIFQP